jgi:hypothetical protein
MEKHGKLEHSTSSYRAPLVMVKKKRGDIRVLKDFRQVRCVTIKNRYPLPLIEDILHLLFGTPFFLPYSIFSVVFGK